MEKNQILNAIKLLRDPENKKNFNQTFDFIVNLKNLNLKKPEEKVDIYTQLPNRRSKKLSNCAFVDDSLVLEAKKAFDGVVEKDQFAAYGKDKKKLKELAVKFDFFVAQANLMAEIAKNFGKVLGQRGKMPNPKAGCVIPPKIVLAPLIARLQNTVRLQTKNELVVKCPVGTEDMDDEKVTENVMSVYDTLIKALPQGENNVRTVYVKLTMSHPIKVGGGSDE